MALILKFLIPRKTYVIIISTAVIVLLAVVVFYETNRRSMTRASHEMIDSHHNEVYALNHEISARDRDIAQMADQYSRLNARLTNANSSRQTLQNRYNSLQQQFDDLSLRYREIGSHNITQSLGLRDFDAPLISHVTADPDKIDMIVRHFSAMHTGDLDAYLLTVNGGQYWEYPGVAFGSDNWWDWDGGWTWVDFLLLTFHRISEREYYRMEVKFIPDWWPRYLDSYPVWGGHLWVWVLVQETPDSEPFLRQYSLGVTASGGENWNEWRVYDYH